MIFLCFFALLVVSPVLGVLNHETVQVKISQTAIDYINNEIRGTIPVIESELQRFPLPEAKGSNFRLHNLVLKRSKIGQSTVNFQNNGLRLKLFNNNFVVGGKFWVQNIIGVAGNVEITASNFGLDATLNFHYNKVKSVSLQSCNVYIADLNINLYNPLLNFILGVLKGTIRDMARGMLCDALRDSGVPAINKALGDMPDWYNVGTKAKIHFKPGYANVDSTQLTTAYFAAVQPLTGDIDWNFKEQNIPRQGSTGQCCVWMSDFLLNTLLGTFMAPGALSTTLDAADFAPAGIPAPLKASIVNNMAPFLSLTPEKIYMEAGLNYSITGEGDLNLGKYSNLLYLDSDTDITLDNFLAAFKKLTQLDMAPALESIVKRELCEDDRNVARQCVYWAGRGECRKNPNYMLYHCKKSCGQCQDEEDKVDAKVNAVEYLLNNVSPTKDYIQFYNTISEVLNGSVRYCGKFRPTQLTRDLIHNGIRDFLRSQRK